MKEKLLFSIFIVNLAFIFISFILYLFGLIQFQNTYIYTITILIALVQLFVHAIFTLTPVRGLFFITVAATLGFISETVGLRYGAVFGVPYVYAHTRFMLGGVPIEVIGFWAFFIYMGYCLSNSFLYALDIKKPQMKKKQIGLLLLLIVADALFVTAIDLFMDPLHVQMGTWSWLQKGPYFGIPLTNFTGWFQVAFISSAIFRVFEYFYPQKKSFIKPSVIGLQSINYLCFAIGFACFSLSIGMWQLTIVGSLFMFPQSLFCIYLLMKKLRIFPFTYVS